MDYTPLFTSQLTHRKLTFRPFLLKCWSRYTRRVTAARVLEPHRHLQPGTCSGTGTAYRPTALPTVVPYGLPVPEQVPGLVDPTLTTRLSSRCARRTFFFFFIITLEPRVE